MSIENILNFYRQSAEKKISQIKWNPKASEETRAALLKLVQGGAWVPIIARFEGFYGHPYSEHRPKVPLQRNSTRRSGGWYKVYKDGRKVGQATIGHGHVLNYSHAGGQMADWWEPYWGAAAERITREQAKQLLYHNGRSYSTRILQYFTAAPTQGQFNVILSRAYIGGTGSSGMRRLIKYVNKDNSAAFNKKLRTWYDYAWGPKYEDPNWCADNLASYRDKKGYNKLATDAEKIEKCKARVEYTKRYRRGWRNRTNTELKIASGQTAPEDIQIPTDATGATTDRPATDRTGQRIALIGDSNAWELNKEYASHFQSQGAKVHKFAYGGSGCQYWLKVLTRLSEKGDERIIPNNKINTGAWRLQEFFKKDGGSVAKAQIHVVCLGGNNMNLIYKESNLRNHVAGCIKPLMELIKKFNGTFAGTVPIGTKRRGKTGEASNILRAKMNAAYAEAAKQVGIQFWNPTTNIAYNTDDLHKKGRDGIHITRTMARQEFQSRKTWLGGGSGAGLVGAGALQGDSSGATGDKKGRFDHLKFKVTPEEFLAQYAAFQQRDKSKDDTEDERFKAIFQNRFRKQIKDMLPGDLYTDPYARDPRYGDDPEAAGGGTQQAQTQTPEDVPEEACPEGKFVNKYKNFPTQVPDFNFSDFYSELDKYFGSAEKMLQPQGKDCVFGDEHYAAWSKLQQKKQMQSPYISESMSTLRDLIKEMKKRY